MFFFVRMGWEIERNYLLLIIVYYLEDNVKSLFKVILFFNFFVLFWTISVNNFSFFFLVGVVFRDVGYCRINYFLFYVVCYGCGFVLCM